MKKDLKVQNKNLYQKMGVSFLFFYLASDRTKTLVPTFW